MGASLLAIAVGQLAAMLNVPPPSRASLAPTLNLGVFTDPAFTTNPLWEPSLLAMAVGQLAAMLNVPPLSRASSLPQGLGMDAMFVNKPGKTVGAELARYGGGSACIDVECAIAIASKLAHRDWGWMQCL